MTPPIRRLLALTALAAAVGLTACSSPLSSGPATTTTAAPTTTTIPGSDTPAQTRAADYRAGLTYLMVEHVYLLERATDQVVAATPAAGGGTTTTAGAGATTTTTAGAAGGGATTTTTTGTAGGGATTTTTAGAPTAGSAPAGAATTQAGGGAATSTTLLLLPPPPGAVNADTAGALDQNSHDLTDMLAEADGYGSTFATTFYGLWSGRINAFEAYARAKAAGDTAVAAAAQSALAANASQLAALMHATNKYISVTTLSGTGMLDELTPLNQAATTFIDDQAAKSATLAADLVKAAELMYHTADYLGAAAAKLDPAQYPGTATGTSSNLRASLTMLWVEHVELMSIDLGVLSRGVDEAPWFAAVRGNNTQLQNALAVNIGDPPAGRFVLLWGSYIQSLRAFTAATKGGDLSAAASASDALGSVPQAVGTFFHVNTPRLGADVVAGDLAPVVSGLQDVGRAVATGAPAAVLSRRAAGYVPKLASDVAEAFARANPNVYLP